MSIGARLAYCLCKICSCADHGNKVINEQPVHRLCIFVHGSLRPRFVCFCGVSPQTRKPLLLFAGAILYLADAIPFFSADFKYFDFVASIRWANLPPELRAIKDRWLGASVEDLGPATSAALRGDDEQRRHQDVQEVMPFLFILLQRTPQRDNRLRCGSSSDGKGKSTQVGASLKYLLRIRIFYAASSIVCCCAIGPQEAYGKNVFVFAPVRQLLYQVHYLLGTLDIFDNYIALCPSEHVGRCSF